MHGTQIAKWGNSSAVRIPENILKETGISKGDNVEIISLAGSIIIRKKPGGKKSLKAAGMLSEYSNPELRKLEKDAWKNAAVRKYGSH